MASNDKIIQMINFIETEANEKANEIKVQAQEEFSIEKQNLVDEEKKNIRKEFKRKEKQVLIQKKIAHSNILKDSRIEILQSKEELFKSLLSDTKKQLKNLQNDKEKYKTLLYNLTSQCLGEFFQEKKIYLTCRENDKSIIEQFVPKLQKDFLEIVKKKQNEILKSTTDNKKKKDIKIIVGPLKQLRKTKSLDSKYIDENGWLHDEGCGGVIVCAHGDRIKINNTLEKRLDLCFQQQIPLLRSLLFPKN